jgi:hypothetical protein
MHLIATTTARSGAAAALIKGEEGRIKGEEDNRSAAHHNMTILRRQHQLNTRGTTTINTTCTITCTTTTINTTCTITCTIVILSASGTLRR